MEKVAEKIKMHLALQNKNVRQIAAEAGISRHQIDNILYGRSYRYNVLAKVADVLKVPVDSLIEREDSTDKGTKVDISTLEGQAQDFIKSISQSYRLEIPEYKETQIVATLLSNCYLVDNKQDLYSMIKGILCFVSSNQ